jgi:hypothetical protein
MPARPGGVETPPWGIESSEYSTTYFGLSKRIAAPGHGCGRKAYYKETLQPNFIGVPALRLLR